MPLYTLTDRQAVGSKANGWEWQYRGLHQGGTESERLPEGEARDSFTPMQLDVFNALWEAFKGGDCRPRQPKPRSKGERDQGLRKKAQQDFPTSTGQAVVGGVSWGASCGGGAYSRLPDAVLASKIP